MYMNDYGYDASAVLRAGDTGSDVVELQERLTSLEWLGEGPASSVLDASTEKALKAFQTASGLIATGVVTTSTWEALFADDAPHAGTVASRKFPWLWVGIGGGAVLLAVVGGALAFGRRK